MQDFMPFGGTAFIGSTQTPEATLAAEEEDGDVDCCEELLVGVVLPVQTGSPPVVLKSCPAHSLT